MSPPSTLLITRVAVVTPERLAPSASGWPLRNHWYESGAVPPAETQKVAVVPARLVRLAGWLVIKLGPSKLSTNHEAPLFCAPELNPRART